MRSATSCCLAAFSVFLSLAACGDLDEKGSGTRLVPVNVQTIFDANCAFVGCHAGSSPQQNQDLSEGSAYDNIVSVPSQENPSLLRINPFDPDNSYLVRKIEGVNIVPGTERMPLGGPYLGPAEIDTIRTWVLNGALPR